MAMKLRTAATSTRQNYQLPVMAPPPKMYHVPLCLKRRHCCGGRSQPDYAQISLNVSCYAPLFRA